MAVARIADVRRSGHVEGQGGIIRSLILHDLELPGGTIVQAIADASIVGAESHVGSILAVNAQGNIEEAICAGTVVSGSILIAEKPFSRSPPCARLARPLYPNLLRRSNLQILCNPHATLTLSSRSRG